MRAALAALLTLAIAPAAAAQPVKIRGADPERYTLDLRYEDRGAGVLAGTERIEFVNRGPRALSRVWLRLWANGPDDCRPRRIRVEVEEAGLRVRVVRRRAASAACRPAAVCRQMSKASSPGRAPRLARVSDSNSPVRHSATT